MIPGVGSSNLLSHPFILSDEVVMKIRGLQQVNVEVTNYDMKEYVVEWLRNSIKLGEHDYIDFHEHDEVKKECAKPAEFVHQEDRSTHKTEYSEVERRPATLAELHVWQVLQDIK